MQQRGEPKMKANEFVKKFGLDAAKHKADELKIIESMGGKLSIEDNNLIRLVESNELVEKDFDSVEIAEYEYMISGCYSDPYWIRIKQAIADVGSCYA